LGGLRESLIRFRASEANRAKLVHNIELKGNMETDLVSSLGVRSALKSGACKALILANFASHLKDLK